MNAFAALLFGVLLCYVTMAFLAGRFLVYNDLRRRTEPSQGRLTDFEVESVCFTSHDGLTLRGWFVNAGCSRSGATVIMLHGWHRDRSRLVENIRAFAGSGFNVLAYDQRGHGTSDTGLISFGPLEGNDLVKAIEYACTRPEVDPGRLGLAGFSLGASAIIYALARSPRPRARCVVLEGVFSVSRDVGTDMLYRRFGRVLGAIVAEGLFTAGSFIASGGRFRDAHPVRRLAALSGIPLLVIRSDDDHMVPASSAQAFIEHAPRTTVVWQTAEGSHYNTVARYPEGYRKRVCGFLETHLAAPE